MILTNRLRTNFDGRDNCGAMRLTAALTVILISLIGCQGSRDGVQFQPKVDIVPSDWPAALTPEPLLSTTQPVSDIEVGVLLFDAGVDADDKRANAVLRRVQSR